MSNLDFGQYIVITHTIERIKQGNYRYWSVSVLDEPKLAIFLRKVKLSDGNVETENVSEYGWEPSYELVFNPTKTYDGAWICREGRKPELALMSTLHDMITFLGFSNE